MNRRAVMHLGAAAIGVGALGAFARPQVGKLLGPGQPGRLLPSQTPLPAPYQVTLPVPATLTPARVDATTDYYEITQQVAQLRILPGLPTPAWTYNGTFPGPTIVSRAGRRTVGDLSIEQSGEGPNPRAVTVCLSVQGSGSIHSLTAALADIDGILAISGGDDDSPPA